MFLNRLSVIKLFVIGLFVLSLFVIFSTSTISHANGIDRPLIDGIAYTQASQLVEVEPGRKLNLYCLGEGSPTVIFESGLTEPINNWGWVQPVIAHTTRTCSYDRAGVGFSDPLSRPATSVNIVDDIHRMLGAAGINPPYVLVGHSTGGLSARLYAHTYPDEIVGMLLVDPSDENQVQKSREIHTSKTEAEWQADTDKFLQSQRDCMNQAKKGFVAGAELTKQCQNDPYKELSAEVQKATSEFQMRFPYWQAQVSELESFFTTSAEQLRHARKSFGDMPLIVLTETRVPPENASPEKMVIWQASYNLWKGLHEAQAQLSTRGIHEIVPDAKHHIQFDNPEAVENAILRILKMVSADKKD